MSCVFWLVLQKGVERNIAVVLTIIENVEVFLEMASSSNDLDSMRWLVVAIVQVVKFVVLFHSSDFFHQTCLPTQL